MDKQTRKDIINLLRDLEGLNLKNTNKSGMIEIGPGKGLHWKGTATRLLEVMQTEGTKV